jgi:hypothetical protein
MKLQPTALAKQLAQAACSAEQKAQPGLPAALIAGLPSSKSARPGSTGITRTTNRSSSSSSAQALPHTTWMAVQHGELAQDTSNSLGCGFLRHCLMACLEAR